MEELVLWKEFQEAKVPYVSNRSKDEFYRVFGKISKEQFISLDLQNGWGNFDSKSGIRKFLFLQKYLRGEETEWNGPEIATPKDEIFIKLKKQREINQKLKSEHEAEILKLKNDYKTEIQSLKEKNKILSNELSKAKSILRKMNDMVLLCGKIQNAYADCLVEDTENERTESIK